MLMSGRAVANLTGVISARNPNGLAYRQSFRQVYSMDIEECVRLPERFGACTGELNGSRTPS